MEIIYIDNSDLIKNAKIVNAINKATNGTFVNSEYVFSTCMGWSRIFDEEGREVSVNPNYLDSIINICGTNYNLTRKGWKAYIWKSEINGNYCKLMSFNSMKNANYEDLFFAVIDLTPDYVREYWETKKNNEK